MSYLTKEERELAASSPDIELREQDRWLPIANVARLMKNTLPTTAKVSKDAKECMQECVSEFISFITSEASDKCVREKRKTINGEDILYLMHDLGFENYAEVLKIYLAKYREQQALKQERGETRPKKQTKKQRLKEQQEAEEYIKTETEQPETLNLDSLAHVHPLEYLASPADSKQSPDTYFHPYESNDLEGTGAIATSDPHMHLKHDLVLGEEKEGYRYGDFIDEEEIKENGKGREHMDDLKLGDDADIDNLTAGITNRSYY